MPSICAPCLRPLPVRQGPPPFNLALGVGTRTSNVPAVHVDSRTAAVCGAQLENHRKYHTPAVPWPRRNLRAAWISSGTPKRL